ncbi:MAG: tRNA (N(6)-L-threonylcarbamoyladenosine(37)-C(2))-methylthiotransferase MtaB [Lachnospiraceae bacterium]|nr:tRNA (N(6)-L-threonylcarbamoyladenosine(37)-C(2))-methylthiotransferase MtaB [Lachnospiraceae bacterium]
MNNKECKVAFQTLGCKVNSYETEAMQNKFENAGYTIVKFNEKADVYIINTCSVTNMADRKSRQVIHRAKKLNKNAIVVAVGCYAQAAKDELEKEEYIDIILGNNNKAQIVEIVEEYIREREKIVKVLDISKEKNYEDMELLHVLEHTRAYIKVQDGCNQFCSYCIIPYTRGRVRSRGVNETVEEIKNLVLRGYKEFVLTGIHLSSYGVDLGNIDLLGLILKIHEIEGVERIRLGSLEPRIITKEFANTLSKLEKICPHFHLSLQSGCDATLKRMNRRYSCDEYYEKCEILRDAFDNPAITTDIIVGFPGETDEEFEQTKAFVEKVKFFETHIFKYSRRKGTVADKLKEQVKDDDKNTRSEILLDLNLRNSKAYMQEAIGKPVKVLIEEPVTIEGKEYYVGHTKTYLKVAVELTEAINVNDIVELVPKAFLNEGILLA